MKRKLIITLCAALISSAGMAQEEVGKNNILHRVKKIADATMVHGVDTNYIKTPEQPWHKLTCRCILRLTELNCLMEEVRCLLSWEWATWQPTHAS